MKTTARNIRPASTPWMDLFNYAIVIGVGVWLMTRATHELGYHWQWYRIPRYLFGHADGHPTIGPLLDGLLITFKLVGISLVFSFGIALLTAVLRLSNSFVGRGLARGYLELIRNTPLLIQIFFVYFVIGPLFGVGRFTSAVVALSFFEGAYASEILRAGIVSIDRGQWEAAHSIGLGRYLTYRLVVVPQALRRMLPPLTSQAVSLVKDSALVSTIAVYDLTMQAQAIISETFLVFEIWFTVAAIYLLITLALSFTAKRMEIRWKREF